VQDDTFTYDIENRRIGKNTLSGGQSWHLYAVAIDSLLGRVDSSGNAMWYLTDKLGSVRENVDGNGNVLDSITYDTFGNILAENHPTSGDRFKYTSREWDSEIGQYFYRARFYSPTDGRFESEDPLGFAGRDTDLYRYVLNGPTNFKDSLGLQVDGKLPKPKVYKVVAKAEATLTCNKGVLWPRPSLGKKLTFGIFGSSTWESAEIFGFGRGKHDGTLEFPITAETVIEALVMQLLGLEVLEAVSLAANMAKIGFYNYSLLTAVADLSEAAKDAMRNVDWKGQRIVDDCPGATKDAISRTNWDIPSFRGLLAERKALWWDVHGEVSYAIGGRTTVDGEVKAWFVDKDAPSSNAGGTKKVSSQ
jgi:RHS repeat-associated protein